MDVKVILPNGDPIFTEIEEGATVKQLINSSEELQDAFSRSLIIKDKRSGEILSLDDTVPNGGDLTKLILNEAKSDAGK